jgi:hypothetical protein
LAILLKNTTSVIWRDKTAAGKSLPYTWCHCPKRHY